MVKGKVSGKPSVDLLRAQRLDLFGGKHIFHIRRDLHLAQPQPVVERIARKRAVGADHHDRHAEHLHTLADRLRQRRRRTVKAVARLRIHQHGALQRAHGVKHIPHKRGVRTELARRDAAQIPHQPLFADKAVRRADDVERARIEHRRGDLEVNEARVVH